MAVNHFQISERFRAAIEARIAQLEQDAARDADLVSELLNEDHQRRQLLLVEAQIDDAVRLRARLTFRDMVTVDSVLECLSQR